jgi:hypothetical protein
MPTSLYLGIKCIPFIPTHKTKAMPNQHNFDNPRQNPDKWQRNAKKQKRAGYPALFN